MNKIVFLFILSLLVLKISAQTFVNNGAVVSVTTGALMAVRTDGVTTGSGSLENMAAAGGIFRNAGLVKIEGSFVNDAGAVADGFVSNTGVYKVQGDWENNGSFNADSSTVVLYGANPQQITGSSATTFYNLIDTNTGVKTQTINTYVSGVLTLYSVEHATASYDLVVLNPDPAAIVQNSVNDAFVSSTQNGRLARNTNQKAEYIFPTGINEGSAKVREASVTPPNATPRTYFVRFADYPHSANTTSTDGYDTAAKAGNVGEVNDAYYHLVTASNNDPADLAIFFDPASEPMWQGIGRWQNVPQWQDLTSSVVLPGQAGSTRLKVVRPAWVATTDSPYALIDTLASKADFAFPNAFVANGQNMPVENTYFGIINSANIVTLEGLSIYNRWGEMVFDNRRDGSQVWYGNFQGKLQPQGNYVFKALVRNNTTGKLYPIVTGNIALLW